MEFYEITREPEKALLISVDTGDFDADASIEELTLLTESAGASVVGSIIQRKSTPDGATYLGKGKLAEAELFCHNQEIDLIVCDGELTPSQIRNIENVTDVRVVDRTQLILDIFALRAKTSEGKLQVELAQLKYSLPRLTGKGKQLSRLGGGIGTRGPGETKLESDRRHIMRRMHALQEQMAEVEKRRGLLRKRREKDGVITVALVGYTNAGKSTLMNALTDAGVLAEDKLFATLDPTSRKLSLPNGQDVMLIDTVGFVSRLPHKLVEAFKSTLKQAKYADIVLNVCDIASEDRDIQLEVTRGVLDEIGVDKDNIITVYNKCDKEHIDFVTENGVKVSAKSGFGLESLMNAIDAKLADRMETLDVLLPYSQTSLINTIRENGVVHSEEYTAGGILVKGIVDKKLAYLYEMYKN